MCMLHLVACKTPFCKLQSATGDIDWYAQASESDMGAQNMEKLT
jgi:hypothetical protein